MIEKEIFENLKNNNRNSFAVWAPKLQCDPKCVCDISMFYDFEKIKDKLKPNIIFVGMNLAGETVGKFIPYKNFHSEVKRHNDYRLRDAIVGTPFEGAYMTDMFKLITSSSDNVRKYYKENTTERETAIKEFVEEYKS